MKKIPLSGGKAYALVDDEDFELVSKHNWSLWRNYAMCQYKVGDQWKTLYMHRLIVNAPPGTIVDHISGDGLDNRRENLRICNRSQNARNQRKIRGKSKFKGVCWNTERQAWDGQIRAEGRIYKLGRFHDEHLAALMYDFWAIELHGEYANLNFTVVSKGGYSNGQTPEPAEHRPIEGSVCTRCGYVNAQETVGQSGMVWALPNARPQP